MALQFGQQLLCSLDILRVANLVTAISEEMGFSGERVEGVRMAAMIHDIGKISVPAEILSKPGIITEIEFNLIKTHSQTGYDILKGIDFPWPIAQMVFQHHERIDGNGYPSGLAGDEILLEAKILGVADVVEAMASHRPYRPSLGIKKALDEISTDHYSCSWKDVDFTQSAIYYLRVTQKSGDQAWSSPVWINQR